MERSSGNLKPSSSNRKFWTIFASPDRYFTEHSRWEPLIYTSLMIVYYCASLFTYKYVFFRHLIVKNFVKTYSLIQLEIPIKPVFISFTDIT